MEKSIFNSQYTQFEGAQKGTAVKKLINQAKTYNATVKDANRRIKIKTTATGLDSHPQGITDAADINKICDQIKISNTYEIIVEIDETTGFVNRITIQ